jgi:hypothetical protein
MGETNQENYQGNRFYGEGQRNVPEVRRVSCIVVAKPAFEIGVCKYCHILLFE